LLEGTAREDRNNSDEPQLPVRESHYLAPDWLSEVAREEWNRLEPTLRRSRLLTEGDLAAFAHYCSRYAAARKADQLATKARTNKAWAYWDGFARKAWDAMSKAAQQLGLTPAARGKVERGPEEKKDPLHRFLPPPRAG